jgi:hypothetical protein
VVEGNSEVVAVGQEVHRVAEVGQL